MSNHIKLITKFLNEYRLNLLFIESYYLWVHSWTFFERGLGSARLLSKSKTKTQALFVHKLTNMNKFFIELSSSFINNLVHL